MPIVTRIRRPTLDHRRRCLQLLLPTMCIVIFGAFDSRATASRSAKPAPIATREAPAGPFMDVSGALHAIRDRVLDQSRREDREYVGGILGTPSGEVRYTIGRAAAGVDRVTFGVPVPTNRRLIGFWHTHGRHGVLRNRFSKEDAEIVTQTGLPLYLITPAGEIRELGLNDVHRSKRGGRSLLKSAAPRRGRLVAGNLDSWRRAHLQ